MRQSENSPTPTGARSPRRTITVVLDCGICGRHSLRVRKQTVAPGGDVLAAAVVCWFCDAAPRAVTATRAA